MKVFKMVGSFLALVFLVAELWYGMMLLAAYMGY